MDPLNHSCFPRNVLPCHHGGPSQCLKNKEKEKKEVKLNTTGRLNEEKKVILT